jgi:hypothetical protein
VRRRTMARRGQRRRYLRGITFLVDLGVAKYVEVLNMETI